MSDGVVAITAIAGIGFILVAGAHLGSGSTQAFTGLFAQQGVRDWPMGVQEADAPRFAVAHLDDLRPGQPEMITTSAIDDDVDGPSAELFDLGSHHLDAPHG
jgi:hypothetical protein